MRRLLVLALVCAPPVLGLLIASTANAGRPRRTIHKVIVYGDSLWDGGVTGAGCDSCSSYPSSWNLLEYAVAGALAWHAPRCDGAEWPNPDDGCQMGEDVALRRAGYCPAAGNADFPALTPCLEDNTDADVVVVQFGSNDVRFPDNQNVVWSSSDAGDGTPTQFVLPEHLQGLKAILDQVQAQDQACVVITPPPIWSNEGGINPTDYETANERLDELRQFQLAEARSHGCVHVDLYQTFLDYEEANGEVAMLALYAACPAKGVTQGPGGGDCVHLSAAGNAVMGAHVRDAIQASASRSACGDGLDNDGDGLIDLADPGCGNFSDLDEHASELVCDDGVDNDGDGKADYLAAGGGDPGCYNALSTRENPQCQDGLNNDDRIGIDFDGGRSLDLDDNGVVDAQFNPATPAISPADPQCIGKPWGDTESSGSSCGLGFELVFLAPLIARLGWRRRA